VGRPGSVSDPAAGTRRGSSRPRCS
jgi:hypothetical protein